MKPRILINCSNLHNGGGVAVATSVIDCLSRMDHGGLALSVLLSTPVERNLRDLGTDLGAFERSETCDFRGIPALWQGLDQHFEGFDLVFTVFGPAYFARRNTRHLFGFAQPNILYPDNPVAAAQPALSRWRTLLKFELQAWFFSRADAFVVELEHVKAGLMKRRLFQYKPVDVVYSSVHSVFSKPDKWAALDIPAQPGRLKLGLISRNYPHKNLAILPEVKRLLKATHGRDVDIYVTFPPEEWEACDSRFRENIVNVGALSLSQCPTFYEAMDGVVFPSLLECFSAVPIETMMVGRPLFASNLSFIRDVCGDDCQYVEPQDAADIARVIDTYFQRPAKERQALCDAARAHVLRYPGPEERAASYLNLVRQALA
ncbi:MAG: glycosyltransferase family 4 protein [Gammaproteobacteria bacterium]|uniref:glycosyltransferase family 4 protein n=1 Tax=Rhodoferax sp. TaxID=50421 RepID=UPI00179E5AC5|nr:glycosyltransferase family 4 protein [Rhodoferax sp.]MBU3898721.1 glycosyltransferase family 4 protein [Gammaproteobacteria bacterium]MBA3056444.1 glycosyltransferase family 4 protein [Rhodoferax sp.]MBU3997225.1 glycosyltransferase family 4 protein [Gammaproteobacteria bacterium]MBU4080808.1 glycosyltransferase family 4 protein [Gammaproteobacteria bacterium]MBU4112453.1 glycosyltransferase family 4 protein [Gammaproteobacteria bacterium]